MLRLEIVRRAHIVPDVDTMEILGSFSSLFLRCAMSEARLAVMHLYS